MRKLHLFWVFIVLTIVLAIIAVSRGSFEQETVDKDSRVWEVAILNDNERHELSECIANIFWANLSNYYPYYDIEIVLKRLKELSETQTTPMSPLECRMTYLLPLLEKINAYEAAKDLQKAEGFLAILLGKSGVVEIVKGKLYYEQLKPGEGEAITMLDSPTLRYAESTLDNLKPSRECKDIKITLADTIQGFALGVEGMRIGEQRRIYVHPDLAYGKLGGESSQELVIFDVSIISK